MATRNYEVAVLKRALRRLEKTGAILDEGKCRKARDGYWLEQPWFTGHSAEWQSCFCKAAVLASGLRLFHGGYFVHPCGDPESRWNLEKSLAAVFRHYTLPDAETPAEFGPEAVRGYWRNIQRGAEYLRTMYGLDSTAIADGLDGVKAAAEIFGIPLN